MYLQLWSKFESRGGAVRRLGKCGQLARVGLGIRTQLCVPQHTRVKPQTPKGVICWICLIRVGPMSAEQNTPLQSLLRKPAKYQFCIWYRFIQANGERQYNK